MMSYLSQIQVGVKRERKFEGRTLIMLIAEDCEAQVVNLPMVGCHIRAGEKDFF